MHLPFFIMPVAKSILRKSIGRNIGRKMAHNAVRSIAKVGASILVFATASFAGQPATVAPHNDPAELMRKAVQNEIKASNDDSVHFLFHGTKTTPKGSTTRIYAETKDATAGLVIAYNGKPLTSQQQHDE